MFAVAFDLTIKILKRRRSGFTRESVKRSPVVKYHKRILG